MNRFARIAQSRWQQLAPTAYAQIENPNRHFSTLGEEAEKAWIDLADQLTGPDVPGETYFEKVGRINNARMRAQEMIEVDWLTPPPEVIEPDVDEESAVAEARYQLEVRRAARADQLIECVFSPAEASPGQTDLTWEEISSVLSALSRTGKTGAELTDPEWADLRKVINLTA